MSVTKFDIDNSRFEITKEQILEIVEKLDCLSSTKEQLKKYYSKDFNVTREKIQYYDRTLGKGATFDGLLQLRYIHER